MSTKSFLRKRGQCLAMILAAVGCNVLFAVPAAIAEDPTGDAKPQAERFKLAIVASAAVQETGVNDLLTELLSDQQGIDLVERDLLEVVTAELELSAILGAKDAGARLRLGESLKADLLVLLAYEEPTSEDKNAKPTRELRLVIAETRYGARLGTTLFDYNDDKIEDLTKKIASRVKQVRRRYSGKIERIYAVSALVSKSLSRKYDYLQTGFVHLLQEALMAAPGTACLELEEAQAIDRELRMDGSDLQDRNVPLFVQGDFNVLPARDGEDPRVRVTLQLADGEKELLKLNQVTDSIEQSITWLRTDASDAIAHTADQVRKPVSRAAQKSMLVERADYLDRYFMWKEALGLRQAAFLLDPTDDDLALALELERIRVEGIAIHKAPKMRPGQREGTTFKYPAEYVVQRESWEQLIDRIEGVVATGKLNQREAASLVRYGFRASKEFKPENVPHLDEVKERRQAMFRNVFEQFRQLDGTINQGRRRLSITRIVEYKARFADLEVLSPTETTEQSLGEAVNCCLGYNLNYFIGTGKNRYANMDHRFTLPNILFLFTDVVPENRPPLWLMGRLIINDSNGSSLIARLREKQFTREQIFSLFDALEKTGTEANMFYAKAARVCIDASCDENGKRNYSEEMDARLTALLKEAEERGYQKSPDGSTGFALEISQFRKLHGFFKERRDSELALIRPVDPSQELTRKRHTGPAWMRFWQTYDAEPQIGFEPIEDLQVTWTQYEQAGPSLDVAWSAGSVYVLPAKGQIDKVFAITKDQGEVRDVRFDGQQLWISTKKSGIFAVSLTGEILGQAVADKELPSYDAAKLRAPHIRPLAPGKCLVVGGNVWVATLSLAKSRKKRLVSEVLYQATERHIPHTPHGPASTLQQFFPSWAYEMQTNEGRDVLVVGKRNPPLQIDLKTLEVGTFERPFPELSSYQTRYRSQFFLPLDNGYLRRKARGNRRYGHVEYLTAADTNTPDAATTDVQEPAKEEDTWKINQLFPTDAIGQPNEKLIMYNGAVYSVGFTWRRIDPETLEFESLAKPRVAPWFWFRNVANSAHYGLIVWNESKHHKTTPHRVILPPEQPPKLYTFEHIPEHVREKHAEALKTLWSKYIAAIPAKLNGRQSATEALLWRKEQMGDAQILALNEVYDLDHLVFQQVPLTDESLKLLEGLQVRRLTLYETEVTDAGLDVLKTMPNLEEVWLEGSLNGKEFTDEGLHKLKKLPIKSITLFGSGFTDKSGDILLEFPQLESVTPYDTAISAEAIQRLKANGVRFPNANSAYFPGRNELLRRDK